MTTYNKTKTPVDFEQLQNEINQNSAIVPSCTGISSPDNYSQLEIAFAAVALCPGCQPDESEH